MACLTLTVFEQYPCPKCGFIMEHQSYPVLPEPEVIVRCHIPSCENYYKLWKVERRTVVATEVPA
jgi:hypothetical protein